MYRENIVHIESLLAAVIVNLGEFDVSEALDDVHVIVEALERQFEVRLICLKGAVASTFAD